MRLRRRHNPVNAISDQSDEADPENSDGADDCSVSTNTVTFEVVAGDLLDVDCDIIVHQTNCRSTAAKGLANDLFSRFPYANTYRGRIAITKPATVDIMGTPGKERTVANFNAQIRPGGPATTGDDTAQEREDMFHQCLQILGSHIHAHMRGNITIGFPWRIGCGLAGGIWMHYRDMIRQ